MTPSPAPRIGGSFELLRPETRAERMELSVARSVPKSAIYRLNVAIRHGRENRVIAAKHGTKRRSDG